jgi:exonuclease III
LRGVEELFYTFKKRKLFCLCVQETWRSGRKCLENEGSMLLLAGLEENEMRTNREEQGVGIALSPEAVEAWERAGKVLHDDLGGRLIAVRLLVKDHCGKEVGVFLVSAYCPVGNAEPELWEDFFERLRSCISRKETDGILLIGIDSNSSLSVVN